MTFTAYIQRQKSLIRSRRDERPISRCEVSYEYDTEILLEDLISLKGLNTAERQYYCHSDRSEQSERSGEIFF